MKRLNYQNITKCKENEWKIKENGFGQGHTKGRKRAGQGRPGGMRGGRLKALVGLYRKYCLYLPCALYTAEPGKGLAVFKHYAHSAGPD